MSDMVSFCRCAKHQKRQPNDTAGGQPSTARAAFRPRKGGGEMIKLMDAVGIFSLIVDIIELVMNITDITKKK